MMDSADSPTREEFYRDKLVVREEWFVHKGDQETWARLRVFSDGTADAWEHGEVWGFINEACARFCIREGRYAHPSRVAYNGETPPSNWLREQAAAGDQPFHWGGDWNTGLAEAGAEPDPAGYLLYPMAEEEWLESCATNTLFAAMEQPSEAQLAEFNLACCRRIRHLITDDITMQALEALERAADHATIPAELALAANQVESTFGPAQNESVAKAIGHAVCRCLPPGSFYYETDAVENARLVALYCQWAVGHAAEPAANDEGFDEEVDAAELGQTWLRQRAEQTEADAQCDLIRHLFTRRAD